jgi:hypothetical protein
LTYGGADVKWFSRVLQEPLVHFLVLATGLFVLAHFWGESRASAEPDTIVVSEAQVLSLAQMWQRARQRPPTKEELQGVIDDYINEEVFYREALAMGLDRDDTVIRRRLRQKLEFVAEDLADIVEPTEEQLQKWLDRHPEQFRLEARATFTQVFLNPQLRGDSLGSDVARLLEELSRSEDPADPAELGDRLLLSAFQKDLRESEIANLFGREFASRLLALEEGKWIGTIESGYGVHLVRLKERIKGRAPKLEEVRDSVRREWYAARRAASKEDFYRSLRQRYEIIVQMPGENVGPAASAESP